jgi:cell division protein FtsI (penicillin-binding protein 3)
VISPNHQRRVAFLVTGALGILLAALGGWLLWIAIVSSEPLARRASQQLHMTVPIRPERGSILDRHLRILAASVEVPSVFADPFVVEDPADAAAKAAPVLGMTADELYRILAEDRNQRFVWLKRRVSPETAEAVRHLRVFGIGLAAEGERHYPNGSLAAHVLGFVGQEEQQGLEGLERMFDERLAGRKGQAYILADRRRRPIWSEPDQFVAAEDGQHLVLTIDAMIQAWAEEAVAEAREKFHAASATAIVMDPRTGAILALANVPTFDPNRYGESPVDARRNRAVTDPSPPGSCAKPFFAAVALERNAVRLGEVLYCENGYWAAAKLHDAGHRYGNLTFEEILIKSSNIGMAKLGVRLGNERLFEGLGGFGFGRRTGVWLPGEDPGLVYPLARWTRLSTTRIPFGQEFSATPLQLIAAFAAIANEGKLLRPKILRGVLDGRGRVVADLTEPEVVGKALDPATARKMIDRALVGVVEQGTGKACHIPGYRVFGKTGTTQKIDPETGQMSHTRYIGTFLGGAPADDPRVVVLVSVNEPDPSLGYYGGTVAAPAVKKILERTLEYLGVSPSGSAPDRPPTSLVTD